MRAYRLGLGVALAMGASLGAETTAFSQDDRGTPEQQMACTPDVFRLCGAMIPDAGRITECLRQNTPRLSGPCRAVFEPTVSVSEQTVPRTRVNRQRSVRNRSRDIDDD